MIFEVMDGIPEFLLPQVLSHLETPDLGRCACISQEWLSCAQLEPFASKISRARARAQVQIPNSAMDS